MKWFIQNWFIAVAFLAVGFVIGIQFKNFVSQPRESQVTKVKEWLLWVTTEAEKALGEGTGQLKLRYVYDRFLEKFPDLAMIVSFDIFSKWVDEALERMKHLLSTNKAVKEYVERADDNNHYKVVIKDSV